MSILQEILYGNIRPNEDKVISDEEILMLRPCFRMCA